MFKKNIKHIQKDLFGFFNTLPAKMQQDIKESIEYRFYHAIFCYIPEDIFSVARCKQKKHKKHANDSKPNLIVPYAVTVLFIHSVLPKK